jgi:exopolyphosphatase/pppGpp-phosphohydrolase
LLPDVMIVNATVKPKGKKETRCCIDLGSSYFRKLLVDLARGHDGPAIWAPVEDRVYEERVYIGWGEELAAGGDISLQTRARAAEILKRLSAGITKRSGVRLTVVATNTLRVASNRREIRRYLEERTGTAINVLSERGEAFLGFAGATSGLRAGKPAILVDPGGTSTEVSWGQAPDASAFLSIPVGAHTRAVPGHDMSRMILDFIKGSKRSDVPAGDSPLPGTQESPTIMFTGGTAVSLAVIWNQMNGSEYNDVVSTVVSMEDLEEISGRLGSLFRAGSQLSRALPPERIRLLPQGLEIVRVLMRVLRGNKMTVTARDLRWGVVLGDGIKERGYLADEQESPDSR